MLPSYAEWKLFCWGQPALQSHRVLGQSLTFFLQPTKVLPSLRDTLPSCLGSPNRQAYHSEDTLLGYTPQGHFPLSPLLTETQCISFLGSLIHTFPSIPTVITGRAHAIHS